MAVLSQIKRPGLKLSITAAYLLLVYIMYRLGVSCIYLCLLGIPCPGCGMTRALLALLRLDFAAAFTLHPMIFTMPLVYLYFLFEENLFHNRRVDRVIWIALGIGFFLGGIGIHNFMMGETKKGIFKIVMAFCCGIGGILALIDFVKILMDKYVVDPDKLI